MGDNSKKKPLFRKNIPPTDEAHVSADDINTGPESPQITARVWKSDNWRSLIFLGPFMAVLSFLGAFGFGLENVKDASDVSIAIGIFFCILPFIASKLGHTEFRLGFDWKTNTLWTRHGKKKLRYFTDANRTIDFFVQKYKSSSRGLGRVYFSGGEPRYNSSGAGSRTVWNLMIHRSESIDWDVARLTTKKEAKEICDKANELLAMQK